MKILPPTLVAICGLFLVVEPAFAQTWAPTSAPSNTWISVASSADGKKLVAAPTYDSIYTSTNSGITWTPTGTPSNFWISVASSADGNKLVAAAVLGVIYTSTDSGVSWVTDAVPILSWSSVASSADGSKLVAVTSGDVTGNPPGSIYTSTNCGNTWTQQTNVPSIYYYPDYIWTSVASSADGTKLVVYGNYIYTSTNSGVTWTQAGQIPGLGFSGSPPSHLIASSADGTRLIVGLLAATFSGLYPSPIFISTNSGDTWTQTTTPSNYWTSVASSADGSKLVATANADGWFSAGPIFTSTNFGASWTSNNVAGQQWTCIAMSADGNKLIATAGRYPSGQIYASSSIPMPQLNLASSGSNLTASWIIPSTNFVLQQSLDLSSWTGVTNPPALNLTNLQNEVVLSPTNSSGFYRLKMP